MNEFKGARRARILRNPHVLRLTTSHVVFKDKFKLLAMRRRAEGASPDQIFLEAGFRTEDFKPRYFRLRMIKWSQQARQQVSGKMKVERRGRPKGSKKQKNFETLENLSENDLKSIIRVQEEIISALKKRKALANKN